jgi:outer membrane biosynthesis protein TonB
MASVPMKPSEGSPQPTSVQIPAATSSVITEPSDATPLLKSSEMPNTEVVSNKPGRPVQPSGAPAISQGKPLLGVRAEAEPSPTFVPPEPIRQIMPDLRKFGMATTVSRLFLVEVIVKVNDKGRVTEARLVDDRSNRPPYITFAALDAAKQWTFRPATLRGQNIASDHTLVFRFGSDRH